MQANEARHIESLADKQREWLNHVERCEAAGQTMVAYAGEHSLDLKQFYNWKMRLSWLGILLQSSKPVAFKRISVSETDGGIRCKLPDRIPQRYTELGIAGLRSSVDKANL